MITTKEDKEMRTDSTFAERLNGLMRERRLKQGDIARSLGVSQQAVSKWCAGAAEPRLEILPQLSKLLDVPAGFMAFAEGEAKSQNDPKWIKIRRYDFAAASGSEITMQEVAGVEQITVSREWFHRHIRHPRADTSTYSLINVHGSSMAPTWGDGDVLLVDNLVREIDRDGFYVFTFDGTGYAKRVQRIGRSLLVISDNAKFQPFKIEGDELELVTVHGRIIKALNVTDLE